MKSDAHSNNRSHAGPSLLKMAGQDLGKRNVVALFQGFHHLDMLSGGSIPISRSLVAYEPYPLKAGLDRPVRRSQAIIAGQRGNSGMDRLVELVVFEASAVSIQAHHPVVQDANTGYLLVRGVEAGETTGQSLKCNQHIKHVANVPRTEAMNDSAPAGNKVDQPFARQEFQRFPKRRPGDTKRLAELAFVNPRSGFEHAFNDHIADALDEIVVQRVPHHWKDRLLVHSGL